MQVRKYSEADLEQMIRVWNEVVEDGIAFPQEDYLNLVTGREFFESQTYTAVAEETGEILGLYILHPTSGAAAIWLTPALPCAGTAAGCTSAKNW